MLLPSVAARDGHRDPSAPFSGERRIINSAPYFTGTAEPRAHGLKSKPVSSQPWGERLPNERIRVLRGGEKKKKEKGKKKKAKLTRK